MILLLLFLQKQIHAGKRALSKLLNSSGLEASDIRALCYPVTASTNLFLFPFFLVTTKTVLAPPGYLMKHSSCLCPSRRLLCLVARPRWRGSRGRPPCCLLLTARASLSISFSLSVTLALVRSLSLSLARSLSRSLSLLCSLSLSLSLSLALSLCSRSFPVSFYFFLVRGQVAQDLT